MARSNEPGPGSGTVPEPSDSTVPTVPPLKGEQVREGAPAVLRDDPRHADDGSAGGRGSAAIGGEHRAADGPARGEGVCAARPMGRSAARPGGTRTWDLRAGARARHGVRGGEPPHAGRALRRAKPQAGSDKASGRGRQEPSTRPRCGARCRDGSRCRAPAVWDAGADGPRNGRCRLHGGLSTGARSPDGRRRSIANLRRGFQ